MTHLHGPPLAAWWAENLDQVDREIARLALICRVPILDPGVIDRVLRKDASVCAADNPAAFAKLHDLVKLHFVVRQKSVETVGQVQTSVLESAVIERLKRSFAVAGLE